MLARLKVVACSVLLGLSIATTGTVFARADWNQLIGGSSAATAASSSPSAATVASSPQSTATYVTCHRVATLLECGAL
jgi:hypothetical protein